MADNYNSGTANITADGVVGTSGAATRVFTLHIISGGGGAAVVAFYNGTSSGGTLFLKLTGTVSTGATFAFSSPGLSFPAGCFVDVDSNTTSVLVSYSQG